MSTIAPVMIDVAGTTLQPGELRRLRDARVGGVILFARNYQDPAQLSALVAELRTARAQPLVIAVDHEGGRVQRFREGFSALPPQACLGALHARDSVAALQAAQDLGLVMAHELLACGLDFSFAPVLDLDHGRSVVIGHRALAADPVVVSDLARAQIRGITAAGSAAVGKHFPGHGHVEADSHHALPHDEREFAAIAAADLVPFARLAKVLAGVMPAHVVYGRCAPEPAGFSRFWLQQVLRGQLAFSGVIFSDDLSMAGAHAAGTPGQRARAAFAAGCDMVMLCNQPDDVDALLADLDAADLPTEGAARRDALRARFQESASDEGYRAALDRLDALGLDGWRRAA